MSTYSDDQKLFEDPGAHNPSYNRMINLFDEHVYDAGSTYEKQKETTWDKIKKVVDNLDVATFDQQQINNWYMPQKYYEINVLQWLLDKCQKDEEKMRVHTEYSLFEKKKFIRVLQF